MTIGGPLRDASGLLISTDAAAAGRSYCRGIELLVSASPDADAELRVAVAVDPQFALGWVALAVLAQVGAHGAECADCLGRLATLPAGTTRRERQHVEVIRLLVAGDTHRAAVLGREHLREYPTDALVEFALRSWGPA
jgi:hypothetical protein